VTVECYNTHSAPPFDGLSPFIFNFWYAIVSYHEARFHIIIARSPSLYQSAGRRSNLNQHSSDGFFNIKSDHPQATLEDATHTLPDLDFDLYLSKFF